MYLAKYIEQMGTGTLDMIERCVGAGLREPEFEASGNFVTRIRRAAPAGQPVVFTDKNDVRRRTSENAESQLEFGQLGVCAMERFWARSATIYCGHEQSETLYIGAKISCGADS